MRDDKLAKRRQKKTRTRERKLIESGALFFCESEDTSDK